MSHENPVTDFLLEIALAAVLCGTILGAAVVLRRYPSVGVPLLVIGSLGLAAAFYRILQNRRGESAPVGKAADLARSLGLVVLLLIVGLVYCDCI
jgi:glycerol uptake facilitator-like aquaporin